MSHQLLYIFAIFRAICEYHATKNLPLLLWPFHRTTFSYLRTNQSAAQQIRDRSMPTNDNRKVLSLVSKVHGVELRWWVFLTCREPVDDEVKLDHCHEEKIIRVASFGILVFFQAGNGRKWSIVIGNV